MAKNEENSKKQTLYWSGAVRVFSEISAWIAIPVVLAAVLGNMMDRRYSTGHWLLVSFAIFSFLISSYGIMRSVKKFTSKIKATKEIK